MVSTIKLVDIVYIRDQIRKRKSLEKIKYLPLRYKYLRYLS